MLKIRNYLKNMVMVVAFFSVAFVEMNCGKNNNEKSCITSAESEKSREVLTDLMFKQGFILTGETHDAPTRTETFGLSDIKPAWKIAQWNSKGLLDHVQYNGDAIILLDDCKSVTVDRKSGIINLTVHASKEYTKPRISASEPWVHLLLEQPAFQNPIILANTSEIWVEVEFELTENKVFGKPDPSIHAAQLSWFLWVWRLYNVNIPFLIFYSKTAPIYRLFH